MTRFVALLGLVPACTPETGPTWIDVSCGGGHACALAKDGTVTCWGKASDGQTHPPADVKFTAVSAGYTHSCGLTEVGTVVCWGSNDGGESGDGGTPLGNFIAVSAGMGFTCAVSSDHLAQCWGDSAPQKPDWEEDADTGTPPRLIAIDAGESHVCAITEDHSPACWGAELGNESKTDPRSADPTPGDTDPKSYPAWWGDVIQIGAGRSHSCLLTGEGHAYCFGTPQDDQDKDPAGPFERLAVGAQHNCAIDESGAVSCWGDNGDDESDPPEGRGPYDRISAGDEFTCALEREGDIVCWGNNDLDQAHPPE